LTVNDEWQARDNPDCIAVERTQEGFQSALVSERHR
jgi:hypothetical protein